MGYTTAGNRYAGTEDVTLASAGTVTTATGVIADSTKELGDKGTLRLNLAVTAVAGTSPSMTLTLETSPDGSTGWVSVAAFTAATAVSSQRKVFTGLDRFVRLNVTAFSGSATPSVTHGVSGEAL